MSIACQSLDSMFLNSTCIQNIKIDFWLSLYTLFFYKYKHTNVFLKYKDKYSHIVYIVYQTSNYKQFFGYLAFTKHN